MKIEENLRGFNVTDNQTPTSAKLKESLASIEMPMEVCFLIEFISLIR